MKLTKSERAKAEAELLKILSRGGRYRVIQLMDELDLSLTQVLSLLRELKAEGKIRSYAGGPGLHWTWTEWGTP